MSDHQFAVAFELYLVLGTTFLISTFIHPGMTQRIDAWAQFWRPHWNKTISVAVRSVLLAVFAPLTILNTLHLIDR